MPFDGDLWLHNLHVQVERTAEEQPNLITILQPSSVDHRLYLTSVALQGGSSSGQVRGLSVQDGARVYAEGMRCYVHVMPVFVLVTSCFESVSSRASSCEVPVYT